MMKNKIGMKVIQELELRGAILRNDGSLLEDIYTRAEGFSGTHWLPCYVPAPPVEEESELVRALRDRVNGLTGAQQEMMEAAFEIVKRHEKGGAK